MSDRDVRDAPTFDDETPVQTPEEAALHLIQGDDLATRGPKNYVFDDAIMRQLFNAYLEGAGMAAAFSVGPGAMYHAMLTGISTAIREARDLGLITLVERPDADPT